MSAIKRNWTREETIIALNLFCTIPFNECSARHPLVIEIAQLLGRTPSALNMKIGNFGRLDPTLAERGIKGLVNGSALDKVIWDEFYGDFDSLAINSETILATLRNDHSFFDLPKGEEQKKLAKQRINQDFFRRMVISSYNNRCCITGISNPKLLEACHISDWSTDEENRTNPHNGLSLTPSLHRAYDLMLMAVTPEYKVCISNRIFDDKEITKATTAFFKEINGIKIAMPDRFAPSKELLSYHYQKYLQQ